MNWQDRMEAAIEYLEQHLESEVSYSLAAAAANCSPFHFLRMFEVVTGMTVGEYVRRRRLSRAALDLSGGNSRVTDLALRLGYDSPDAFAKAFKREFGMTPSETRAGGVALRLWPRISFSVVLKGDKAMEFRIEKHGEFAITGLPLQVKMEGHNHAIPKFWDECNANGTVEALVKAMPKDTKLGVLGVCVGDYDEKRNVFTYLIGIESPKDAEAKKALPAGCTSIKTASRTWAIFASRGPMPNAVQDVWKRIHGEWFPGSGYEHDEGPDLEVYGPGDVRAADYYCEIWVPVRKPA